MGEITQFTCEEVELYKGLLEVTRLIKGRKVVYLKTDSVKQKLYLDNAVELPAWDFNGFDVGFVLPRGKLKRYCQLSKGLKLRFEVEGYHLHINSTSLMLDERAKLLPVFPVSVPDKLEEVADMLEQELELKKEDDQSSSQPELLLFQVPSRVKTVDAADILMVDFLDELARANSLYSVIDRRVYDNFAQKMDALPDDELSLVHNFLNDGMLRQMAQQIVERRSQLLAEKEVPDKTEESDKTLAVDYQIFAHFGSHPSVVCRGVPRQGNEIAAEDESFNK